MAPMMPPDPCGPTTVEVKEAEPLFGRGSRTDTDACHGLQRKAMGGMGNRAVIQRFAEALAANDFDAQDALLHDDYVGRYPQSGEVIRGRENRRMIMENYPGTERGITAASDRIIGADDEFVAGPSWNIIHLSGSGDEMSLIGRITYPNGETWHTTLFLTMRDGRIWREVAYFGPSFDPPAWRAPFVELEEPEI